MARAGYRRSDAVELQVERGRLTAYDIFDILQKGLTDFVQNLVLIVVERVVISSPCVLKGTVRLRRHDTFMNTLRRIFHPLGIEVASANAIHEHEIQIVCPRIAVGFK